MYVLLAVLMTAAVAAQDGGRGRYEAALDAWDLGQYPGALEGLIALLEAPGGERYLEDVALLTGELYRSLEVSPSDRHRVSITATGAPEWSPGGRHFVYEVSGTTGSMVHLYRMEGATPVAVAEFAGASATFSPDGTRAAFVRATSDTPGAGTGVTAGGRTAVVEREIASGRERVVDPAGAIIVVAVHYGANGQLFATARAAENPRATEVYRIAEDGQLTLLATEPRVTRVVQPLARGRLLVTLGANAFGVLDPTSGDVRVFEGSTYAVSANGETIVYLAQGAVSTINLVPTAGGEPKAFKTAHTRITSPVLSPDGRFVVFQAMPRDDWELFLLDAVSGTETRVTHEIQHDHTPRFLSDDTLLGIIGENRHRRSYLYDLGTNRRQRLFHNNTIRTLSMEHAWAVSPDGSRVLIVADRDGDTISQERGVYLMDLTATVGRQEILDRLRRMLAGELDLRERGRQMFAAIAAQVQEVVRETSVRRIYQYEKDLVAFGSKYMTEPGNRLAAEYIFNALASFGYEPEYQYLEVSGPGGAVRTANVIATLQGTTSADAEYLVSSHYDSVRAGPGADDDTSGTAALLETARVLHGRPMPATIRFLFLTGEEAGLLGSREYVRQAQARGDRIVGALNNDMIGFADDHRLDDTIRYANAGLRDLQHAAAFLFTNLVTYDSRYYQSTDAASYVQAYGEIVSGIGSYPILGNPHYHQSHDLLDTVSFALITEVAKTTTASIMLMASSPSPLRDVTATRRGNEVEIVWSAPPERDVDGYILRRWVDGTPVDERVSSARARLTGLRQGDPVWVKAVNARGLEAWDWARVTVGSEDQELRSRPAGANN